MNTVWRWCDTSSTLLYRRLYRAGEISLRVDAYFPAREGKLTLTSPVQVGRTLGKEETRATFLHTLTVLQYPALLTGRTRRVVPDRGDREGGDRTR